MRRPQDPVGTRVHQEFYATFKDKTKTLSLTKSGEQRAKVDVVMIKYSKDLQHRPSLKGEE